MSEQRQAAYAPPSRRPRGDGWCALVRRGARLGWFDASIAHSGEDVDARAQRWRACEPLVLRGAVAAGARAWRGEVGGTLALFERLRRGASFQDEVWRRLGAPRGSRFAPAGAACDLYDPREVEKVYAHALGSGGRALARDLYAKLAWIAHDERDASLRIRFSFGSESLLEWTKDPRRAVWSDRFASALFPETAAVLSQRALLARIERLAGRALRFSERIVYNNAPGGGAVFHHDAEPHQLGVLYSQLAGETAWIALSKRALAALVSAHARAAKPRSALAKRVATPARALRALEAEDDGELYRLLNEDAAFARTLVLAGHAFRLRAGDAVVLPSRGPDDTCWHSVFALGARPSLSHSYGIFARRRTRAESRGEPRRYDMAEAR
ncbi:MAG: hypothetical protein EPO68_14830 [Planctomycetota bacterium]|nr:MAG: hypothetical protein EPO68_14830 [Planctomycetota bacterium]